MVDEPPRIEETTEEEKKRRRKFLFFWLFFGGIVALVFLLIFALSRGGDETASPTTTTTVATTTTAQVTSTTQSTATTTEPATTTSTEAPTVAGVWAVAVDVTVATGGCRGEEEEEFEPDPVTITQEGDTLTVTGLGYPKDTHTWEGKIDGNVVTFGGTRQEDEGKTIATFTMEVDFGSMTMAGREDWTWEGPGGSCPDSESVVTATRISP